MDRAESINSSLLAHALPSYLSWAARPTDTDLSHAPAGPAVYALLTVDGAVVQLATTQHLRRAVESRLLGRAKPRESRDGAATVPASSRGRADLAEIARGVRWCDVGSPFEARWKYFRLAKALYPRDYGRLISFGPATFLNIDWRARVPEIRVCENIWNAPGEFVGPWVTRSVAQRALECLWDFFDLCRYPDQVRKAPAGQRCAYADMGRCDAPCDGSAKLAAYVERSRAAWRFACGDIDGWMDAASERMRAAAAIRAFEQAAQIKEQIATAVRWKKECSAQVGRETELDIALLVPVTRRRAWRLFRFRFGSLVEGPTLTARSLVDGATRWLIENARASPEHSDPVERMETTWLIAHFLFSREAESALIMRPAALATPQSTREAIQSYVANRARADVADVEPLQ